MAPVTWPFLYAAIRDEAADPGYLRGHQEAEQMPDIVAAHSTAKKCICCNFATHLYSSVNSLSSFNLLSLQGRSLTPIFSAFAPPLHLPKLIKLLHIQLAQSKIQ